MKNYSNKQRPLYLIGAAILLLLFVTTSLRATAQFNGEDTWEVPLNISQTGMVSNPLSFMDNEGASHLFWQDESIGYLYTHEDGAAWSTPEARKLPFSEPPFTNQSDSAFELLHIPILVVDLNNIVHAFWKNFEGALMYSSVPVANLIAEPRGWAQPKQIAESTISQAISVGVDGRLHLTYIRQLDTPDFPAGVYYRQSTDGGQIWSPSALLYVSSFFRTIAESNAHINIVAGSTSAGGAAPEPNEENSDEDEDVASVDVAEPFAEQVHIVFDNPAIGSVFAVRSTDGGATWFPTLPIDTRRLTDNIDSIGPTHIDVSLVEDQVHLSWWAGHSEIETQCAMYHRFSADRGETWQPDNIVFEDKLECPSSSYFVLGNEGLPFLLSVLSKKVYLQAWDSNQWSEVENQDILSKFLNPDTFREQELGCHQPLVTQENILVVFGCSLGSTEDVWLMKRPLGGLTDWSVQFRPTPVWSQPLPIAQSNTQLLPPVLSTDKDGQVHAFWSQSTASISPGRLAQMLPSGGKTIYYSRLLDREWLEPRPVLTLPEGIVEQPVIAAGSDGSLIALWNNSSGSDFFFSQSSVDKALSVVEWTKPEVISVPQKGVSRPAVLMREDGILDMIYPVPLNEDRGIYLMSTTDKGETWTIPVKIFDGVAEDWEKVGQIRLDRSRDGYMHMLWTEDSISVNGGVLALLYARSEDNGLSWSLPENVTNNDVIWSEVVAIGDREVHRMWLETQDGIVITLWHQYSIDRGDTWSTPLRVSESGTQLGPVAAVLDMSQRLRLLQLVERENNQLLLQEWVWGGDRWISGENAELGQLPEEIEAMTAVVDSNNRLEVLFSSTFTDQVISQDPNDQGSDVITFILQDGLFYTSYLLPSPEVMPTVLPTSTPISLPVASSTPEPLPSLEPTIPLPQTVPNVDDSNNTNDLVLSILPAALFVAIIFVFTIYYMRRR